MVGSTFIIPSVRPGSTDLAGSWTVHWGSLWMITWWCVSFSSTQSSSTHPTDTVWVLFTQEHTHERLAFTDAKGGQVSSKSGHRGTSKVWQGGGGEFIKWGFITAVMYNPDTCGTWTRTEIFRLWMGRAFSSCPGRTCRHNRWCTGKPEAARAKSPRRWCPTPRESRPPVFGSTSLRLLSGQAYFYTALCHSVWGKCHCPGSEGSTSKTCVCSSYTSSERSLRCAQYKPGTRGTA